MFRTANSAWLKMASVLYAATLLTTSAAAQEIRTPADVSRSSASNATLTLQAAAAKPAFDKGSLMFVGNATVIIQYAGFTILTDPNFLHQGDHVHLGYGLKSKRLTAPALTIEQLPKIDLIVLSHMHGDHFDQLVQKELDKNIPIASTEEAIRQLKDMGFKSLHPISKWKALTVRKGDAELRITSTPARHGPPGLSVALPDTMGSILEFSPSGGSPRYRMYITGDTLVHDEIKEIKEKYPQVDLALLHLGGTRILETVLVTMDAEQGVEMMKIIAPDRAIPIHYNDYDVFKSPIEDFQKAIREAGLEEKIIYLNHGETYDFTVRKQ